MLHVLWLRYILWKDVGGGKDTRFGILNIMTVKFIENSGMGISKV
jgi:hypothetical protein